MWSALFLLSLAGSIELVKNPAPHNGENEPDEPQDEPTRTDGKESANFASELNAQITQEAKEVSEGMSAAQKENGGGMIAELNEARTNIDEMAKGAEDNLHKVGEEQTSTLDLLQGQMREASQTEFDHYKEMATVQNEVKGLVTKVSTALEKSQKGITTEFSRLQATSNRFTADLTGQVASSQEHEITAAANIDDSVKNTLADVKIKTDKRTDKLMKEMEKKENIMNNAMTSVSADLNTARIKTVNELDDGLDDSLTKEQDVSSELETIQGETGEIRDLTNRQNTDVAKKLSDASAEVKNDLAESQGLFQKTKEKVLEGVTEQVSKMQANTLATMANKKQRMEEELNEKLAFVEKSVERNTKSVGATTEIVETGVADLNDQIEVNRKATTQSTEKLSALQGHLAATQQLVNEQLTNVKQGTTGSLEEVWSFVDGKLTNAASKLKSDSAESVVKASEHLATVQQQINGKIQLLGESAHDSVEELNKKSSLAEKKAASMLEKVKKVESDVSQEKLTVGKAIPHVKAVVDAAVANVNNNIVNVDSKLSTTKESIEQKIEDTTDKYTKDEQQQVKDAADTLRKELGGSSHDVTSAMGGMMQSLQELKSDTSAKYHEADVAQGRLRSSLEQSIEHAGKQADDSEVKGQQLDAAINKATTSLASEEKTAKRKQHALTHHLSQVVESDIQTAESKGTDQMHDSITKSSDQLKAFEQSADGDIQSDETKLGSYMSESSSKLAGFSSKVSNLGSELEKREQSTEQSNERLAHMMDGISQKQAAVAAKSDAAVQKEKGIIQQRGKDLSQLINEKVDGMTKSQDARLSETERQTKTVFNEESTREKLEQGKVTSTVNQWEHRMQGELQGIEKSLEGSKTELAGYNSKEATEDARFQNEVSGLTKEISTGQQRVEGAVQAEDSRVGGLMDGEVNGMDSLLGAVKATQAQFAKQVGGMKGSFTNQLSHYADDGEARAKSLATKIERLEDTVRDVATGFNEDSKSSDAQIQHTKTRLQTMVHDTDSQMSRFQAEIGDVRSRRSKEAANLQSQTDGLKKELSQQKDTTNQQIKADAEETTGKFKKLGSEQKQYDSKLDSMVTAASTHESALIDAMKDKINELEGSNERLTGWQSNFKKRTLSWRQEVESRIHEIGSPGAHSPNLRSAESLLETHSDDKSEEEIRTEAVKLLNKKKGLSTESDDLEATIAKLEDKLAKHGLVAL